MKKIFAVLCCVGLLAVVGCGDDTSDPTGFSKNYMKKKLGSDTCDLSGLDYKVIDTDGDIAVVEISGKIDYNEKLYLTMEEGAWTIAPMPPKNPVKIKKAVEKAPAKKEKAADDSHGEKKEAPAHH